MICMSMKHLYMYISAKDKFSKRSHNSLNKEVNLKKLVQVKAYFHLPYFF